jgi:hypothetical protein
MKPVIYYAAQGSRKERIEVVMSIRAPARMIQLDNGRHLFIKFCMKFMPQEANLIPNL